MRVRLAYFLVSLLFWLCGAGIYTSCASATQPVTKTQLVEKNPVILAGIFTHSYADSPLLTPFTDDNEEEDEDENESNEQHKYPFFNTFIGAPDYLLNSIACSTPFFSSRFSAKPLSSFDTDKYILYQVFRI